MRSNTWRAIMLLTLTLVLVSSAMDAQAARRSSLAGNQFINDPDDMFAFPQLTMQYKNRVIIDMAPNSTIFDPDLDEDVSVQYGNASVVFGDNFVWNFNTGRSDFLNNTATWASGSADRFGSLPMFGVPGIFNSPVEWWDLGMATHLGDTPFGFNISWANSSYELTDPDPATNEETSLSMLSFQVGASFGSIDLAGEIGFGSFEDKTAGLVPQNQNDYGMFNASLLARGNIDDFGGLDWRWIGAFVSGSHDADASDEKAKTTAFRGSFGPVWGTPGEWEVAAYMNIDYSKSSFGGDNFVKGIGFPGYNVAMEYYLNSWFVARGGIMSTFAMLTESEEVVGGVEEEKVNSSMFMWTFGLGVDKGNWGLDLALEEEDLHSGYLPLNGDVSDTPIAYLTAWLAW